MAQNLLSKEKIYLAGPIQYVSDPYTWREYITQELAKIDVICLNPLKPLFVNQTLDSKEEHAYLKQRLENGDFSTVKNHMKKVLRRDLAAVDKSLAVIFKFEEGIVSAGTMHELVVSSQLRKPLLIISEKPQTLPLWIFALISTDYLFKSEKEVVTYLNKVNNGEIQVDSKYWKIFNPEYR